MKPPADMHQADNWYKVTVQHDQYTFEELFRRFFKDVSIDVNMALEQGALSVKVERI